MWVRFGGTGLRTLLFFFSVAASTAGSAAGAASIAGAAGAGAGESWRGSIAAAVPSLSSSAASTPAASAASAVSRRSKRLISRNVASFVDSFFKESPVPRRVLEEVCLQCLSFLFNTDLFCSLSQAAIRMKFVSLCLRYTSRYLLYHTLLPPIIKLIINTIDLNVSWSAQRKILSRLTECAYMNDEVI